MRATALVIIGQDNDRLIDRFEQSRLKTNRLFCSLPLCDVDDRPREAENCAAIIAYAIRLPLDRI